MKNTNILKFVFARDFFKDQTAILLFVLMTLLVFVNLATVLLLTDPGEQHVTTSYNAYGAGEQVRGAGYSHYVFGIFALVSYGSFLALSIKTFNIRKSLSILQMYLGVIVLFTLIFVGRAVMVA